MRRTAILALTATALGTAAFATGATAAAMRGGGGGPTGGGHAMSAPSFSGHAAPSFSGHGSGFAAAPSGRAAVNPGFAASPGFHHGFGHHRHHRGFGAFAPGFAYDYGDSYTYDYGDDGSCTQLRRVATPWGWQWQRVWVC
jgi:hypothetical protein